MVRVHFVQLTEIVEPALPDEGGFVSYCPELDVASQGESIEEALDNLRDALETYLATLEELGDIDRVLAERKVKLYAKRPSGRAEVAVKTGEVVSTLVASIGGTRT